MTPARSRTEEHVGEWKVSITADAPEALFGELTRIIAQVAGEGEGEAGAWESLDVRARDLSTLVVDVANELIGRAEANGVAYDEMRDVTLVEADGEARLAARVRGRRVAHWRSPLKAATYHALKLDRRGGEWRAEVLFDV